MSHEESAPKPLLGPMAVVQSGAMSVTAQALPALWRVLLHADGDHSDTTHEVRPA